MCTYIHNIYIYIYVVYYQFYLDMRHPVGVNASTTSPTLICHVWSISFSSSVLLATMALAITSIHTIIVSYNMNICVYWYIYIYIYIWACRFFLWVNKNLGTPRVKPPTFYHFYRTFTEIFKNKIGLTRGVRPLGGSMLDVWKTYREGWYQGFLDIQHWHTQRTWGTKVQEAPCPPPQKKNNNNNK